MTDAATDGGVTAQFKDDSAKACIRALRRLEATAITLEKHAAELYPADAEGKLHFGRVLMEGAAAEIRASWSQAIADVETRIVDDPVEHLSTQVLRDEVRYWRGNAASTIQTAMIAMQFERADMDWRALCMVGWLNPWREGLRDALAGDYFPTCEACGKPVRDGDLIVTYDDVGDVHAACCGLSGDALRLGAEIPVDPASLDLEEGETAPEKPVMIVTAYGETYTHAKVADVLAKAFEPDNRACRICGCTEARACATPDGPCSWVERDLCSNPACVAAANAVREGADHG